jgi:Ca2+-binding RTX toxin-like protein
VRRFLVSSALGLALLLVPAAAHASNVASSNGLNYFALPGETNNVRVSLTQAGFVVDDSGATITPMTGCVGNGPHQAICTTVGVDDIRISLGDMNDQAAIDPSVPPLVSEADNDPSVEIEGDEGNDTISGGARTANQLFGDSDFGEGPGDGADVINGGNSQDELFGDGGNDTLNAGAGRDELSGGSGNDTLNGGDGNDEFDGGTGPDGADVINGGRDSDEYNASDRFGALHITLDGAPDDGEGCPGPACEGDNVQPDVEEVDSGPGNDVLVGGPKAEEFRSGDGNDSVDGGGGPDGLFGGRGDDTLHGGPGDDFIGGFEGTDQMFGDQGDDSFVSTDVDDDPDVFSGGKGTDLADYSEANSAIRVTLDNKANDGVAAEGDNVRSDVEDVLGSQFADVLVGSAAPNELEGNDGGDRLVGKAGADGLVGGRGADVLNAGKGADFLDGGAAPDRLNSRDGKADEVDCGSSFDRVKGDRVDRLAGDCDKASLKR